MQRKKRALRWLITKITGVAQVALYGAVIAVLTVLSALKTPDWTIWPVLAYFLVGAFLAIVAQLSTLGDLLLVVVMWFLLALAFCLAAVRDKEPWGAINTSFITSLRTLAGLGED